MRWRSRMGSRFPSRSFPLGDAVRRPPIDVEAPPRQGASSRDDQAPLCDTSRSWTKASLRATRLCPCGRDSSTPVGSEDFFVPTNGRPCHAGARNAKDKPPLNQDSSKLLAIVSNVDRVILIRAASGLSQATTDRDPDANSPARTIEGIWVFSSWRMARTWHSILRSGALPRPAARRRVATLRAPPVGKGHARSRACYPSLRAGAS